MRKVLIVVPYKSRDLEGHALVGYHLKTRYGYEVVYSNGYGIERKLLKEAPDALVLDHLAWNFKAKEARLAKELGMKLVVMPTEGLFQNKEGALGVAGMAHGVTHIVDAYMTWGHFARNAILEKNLIPEENIHTVGCHRFDFYAEPYLSLMDSKDGFLGRLGVKNPHAPLILWATNTPYATRDVKDIRNRYVKRAGWSEAKTLTFLEDNRKQFESHSAIARSLAERHPEWNFVIKVHPAEWIDPYVGMARQLPNVYLGFDSPIRDYLLHCDVLLQRNCTTATEAWIFGKPVIQMEAGSYDAQARPEYTAGNHVADGLEEVDAAVQMYLSGGRITDEQRRAREEFIRDFYYQVDGRASERCAAIIHKVLSPPDYDDDDRARARAAARQRYAELRRSEDALLTNRVKDLLGLERELSLRFWRKYTKKDGNLGLFTAEAPITPDMVEKLYRRYETVTAQLV